MVGSLSVSTSRTTSLYSQLGSIDTHGGSSRVLRGSLGRGGNGISTVGCMARSPVLLSSPPQTHGPGLRDEQEHPCSTQQPDVLLEVDGIALARGGIRNRPVVVHQKRCG